LGVCKSLIENYTNFIIQSDAKEKVFKKKALSIKEY
jgi:hypothetical protein